MKIIGFNFKWQDNEGPCIAWMVVQINEIWCLNLFNKYSMWEFGHAKDPIIEEWNLGPFSLYKYLIVI